MNSDDSKRRCVLALQVADFDFVRKLVYDASAIVVEPGKEYLVETRLIPLTRQEGFSSITDLVASLRTPAANGLRARVVEAMTTNETSFFRDLHPFSALRTRVMPELLRQRSNERTLDIWCAACSSGQEPYTVAMLLHEDFAAALSQWRVRIIASDLSDHILERARKGSYSQLEVNRGLPAPFLVKYLEKDGVHWVIKPEIRRMVEFRKINLAAPWPALPQMDVILIRNVLIYFDAQTKKTIFAKARGLLRAGGYLFLGTAETTINLDDRYERVPIDTATCYRVRAS